MDLALAQLRGTRPVVACFFVLSHLDEVCGQGALGTSCKCVAVLAFTILPQLFVGIDSPQFLVIIAEVLIEVDFLARVASSTFAQAALSGWDVDNLATGLIYVQSSVRFHSL